MRKCAFCLRVLLAGVAALSPRGAAGSTTVVATISLPANSYPHGVGVNPATNRIYVANTGGLPPTGTTVSVIDGVTNTVTATVTVGTGPFGIGVNRGTNRIYVSNKGDDSVSVINGATNTVIATVPLLGGANEPEDVGVNPVTNKVYVANWNAGAPSSVSVVNGATNTWIANIPTGNGTNGVAVNPVTNRVYVSNFSSNTVAVIDGATDTLLATIPFIDTPNGIDVDPLTNRIYVTNFNTDSVTIVDGGTNTIITTVTVGDRPDGVAVNSFGNKVYVANTWPLSPPGSLSGVSTTLNRAEETIALGSNPREADFNAITRRIYVANYADFTVSVLEDPSECCDLVTADPGGTVTVTGAGRFEMRFNKATGGGVDRFFDLAEDSLRANDLAAGTAFQTALLDDEFVKAGVGNPFLANLGPDAKLDLLEATPTRVRVRSESFYAQDPTLPIPEVLAGVKGLGDYTLQSPGRLALRWNQQATSAVAYDNQQRQLSVHRLGSGPLSAWAGFTQSGPICFTSCSGPAGDDFVLLQNEQAGARTDFLWIPSQDWATATATFGGNMFGSEWVENSWISGAGITSPGPSFSDSLLYFKPTSLVDPLDAAVTTRSSDYRTPTAIALTQGAQWRDLAENTLAVGDFFNESEAAYAFDLSPTTGLVFDITGSFTVPRYKPFFKVRQWRSLQDPPSVTLEGMTLTNDLDFKADLKPISRAHFANTLSWHSTLESPAVVATPEVGGSGGLSGTTTLTNGRYGQGALLNENTDYVSSDSGSFNQSIGTLEFWYQPAYNYNDGQRHILWVNAGVGPDYFVLEKTGGNQLLFTVQNTGGSGASSVTISSANFSWRADDWVHIRSSWDSSALPAQRLRVFVNGVEPAHTDAGAYSSISMNKGPTYFGGCGGLCPFGPSANANGVIDEPHIYVGGTTNPSPLAHGGLVGHADEYLGDPSGPKNLPLSFFAVDSSRRGQYLYLGADSKFRGLNIYLATPGAWSAPGDLVWEYWNGTGWADLETGFGFTDETNDLTRTGTTFWTSDPTSWSVYSVNGGPDLYYVRAYLAGGIYSTLPIEGLIKTDVLLFQYCGDITASAGTFVFTVPTPTAVDLMSFEARGLSGAVELTWETASELKNLGFHLYRSMAEGGPYERITSRPIPGLGSSPSGARYRYTDSGLSNGQTYFYELEDIETTGKTNLHGPVSAEPVTGGSATTPSAEGGPRAGLTYGEPSLVSMRVVERSPRHVVVELLTDGFQAEPRADGSVQLSIPGFEEVFEPGSPGMPRKRSWLEVEAGRGVRLVSARAEDVEAFSLRPAAADAPEVVASARGTVRAGRRAQREGAAFRSGGLYPEEAARLLSVGYQGVTKKALVELSPLRWDRSRQELLLARKLTVRLAFSGREEGGHREPGSHGRRGVTRRLLVIQPGLYRVSFKEVMGAGRRGVSASTLRLSRQGQPVAFHLEPDPGAFAPGSTLYFVSGGESLNPYGREAAYELELGAEGTRMPIASASPAGSAVSFHWQDLTREENRYYQAGLLEAEDLWLWDLLFAPATGSYPFELGALAPGSEPAYLEVRLQGVSDFPQSPDHHLRVSVNGSPVADSTLEGKEPLRLTAEIPPGVLREGENALEIENVGDTGATYSMVMLDRFSLRYPRALLADGGKFQGSFSESGVAEVAGLGEGALLLDVTEAMPRWLEGGVVSTAGVRFGVESGRRYLAVSAERVLRPEVKSVRASGLKNNRNQTDYLLLGPRELLGTAEPLLELRRRQGLTSRAVPMEDIYSEFGFGESRPEAVREFLSYAYHHWRKPAPRYVVLLGDATYDFKDYLGTGVRNQAPPLLVKTTYLWTASDSAFGAVNGEDALADLALGRLPAKTVEEARVMVEKVLEYEASGEGLSSRAVLVADDADSAGDFQADAEEIAGSLLASREVRKIYLGQLGVDATRSATLEAFDEGAGTVSYLGHGGIQLWAQENVFDTTRVAALAPQSRQPLVLTLNCLNGYFHFPYFDSLAEELLKAEGKGAIAAFAPSGLSLDEPAHLYHKALLQELLSGKHPRLGDALLAAQAAYASSGAFPDLLAIYLLLGDPALSLR